MKIVFDLNSFIDQWLLERRLRDGQVVFVKSGKGQVSRWQRVVRGERALIVIEDVVHGQG